MLVLALNNYPDRLKPREKALSNGMKSLSDLELLAIILRTGTKEIDVLKLANNLLDEFECISKLNTANMDKLLRIKGIGKAKALEILAIIQLCIRMNQIDIKNYIYVKNPQMIFELYKKRFESVEQEHFLILSLNAKNAIVDEHIAFIGTLSQSLVHPREIFKRIVIKSASAFICIHNHPSGDPLPSQQDIEMTQHLNEIAQLFAIPLIDHIIIGKECYYSFRENEYL